jgi:diguanylate cyclase (GGDEF)-like protein
MERFSLFFDLFQTLSGNIEAGLAYMRGRRDNLTGLYNRQHFKVLLNGFFHKAEKNLGLMFLDMDNFKIFNDTVSHDFGDKLLSALANRMFGSAESQGSAAVPGRFGGDEFCFFISGLESEAFEKKSVEVFRQLTELPLMVSFYFDDRIETDALEINMISFLHRLMRPDVGSRQASRMEFVEKSQISPRGHVLDVWKHYKGREHLRAGGGSVQAGRIVNDILAAIEDKLLYNKIFPEVDPEFRNIIRLFVSLQFRNYTTNRIRDYLIREMDALSVNRNITLKLSAGLAHSSENRLRSVDSLFKAADNRTSMAKHNGRNCVIGVSGQRLS